MVKRTNDPRQLELKLPLPGSVFIPPAPAVPPRGPRSPGLLSETAENLVGCCALAGWSDDAIASALDITLGDVASVVDSLKKVRIDQYGPDAEDTPLGGTVELRRLDDELEVVTPAGRVIGYAPQYIRNLLFSQMSRPGAELRTFVFRTRSRHGHYNVLAVLRRPDGLAYNFFHPVLRDGSSEKMPSPTPTFPDPGATVYFRDTGSSILVLGPDGVTLGHVDPTQVPVLSRIMDRIFRDTITIEMGYADENSFEVILHRRIDGEDPKRNVVRCLRHEPETRQAA